MPIRLRNSSNNYVQLEAPSSIASDVTLTLPNTDGTANYALATNGSGALSWFNGGPAFSAGGTTQALSASTDTKVVLATEDFDTASCYDTSTSRFTPNVAGYYHFVAEAQYTSGTTTGLFVLKFDKSGTKRELAVHGGLDQYMRINMQHLYYMNGTTDYVEFYAKHTGSGSRNIGGTFFQGFFVRPA